MSGDSSEDTAASDVLRLEHVLIFGLLCGMAWFIFKECFAFRRQGLHVVPAPLDEELSELVEHDEAKAD